ncbi:hypothetical protein PVAP13_3NG249800 [Panicum virgatum]|uniref:Uncharacterized protein n=1 Tax=Panicum virgatum TaxID=38727 RepID=A0A8T0ULI2_PANVG|nr:hypothetical protein PVAP13_3NG249800 [Panicum virgatum]
MQIQLHKTYHPIPIILKMLFMLVLKEELQNQNHLLSQKLHPPRDYEAIRNKKIHMLQGCCGRAELHQVTSSNNAS